MDQEKDSQAHRRRGVILLGEEEIAHLLNLPEGWRIQAVRENFFSNGIDVMVTGPELEVVPEGCEAPRLPAPRSYVTEEIEIDGEQVTRVTGIRIEGGAL